ncbi:hypothetical protein EDB19DRAFT_1668979 [Suillus lakei]|nr:hypothetical protein EDB19DRAFT_1668979 [Suillus lakei]
MAVGLLSLPTELICHILLFSTPRDLCRFAITCKIVWNAARNSLHIQYKLELYAQGFNETSATIPDSNDVSRKMYSLKKLASLWRSEFRINTVFQAGVAASYELFPGTQSMKCGTWWMWERGGANATHSNTTWPRRGLLRPHRDRSLTSVVVDPLQDLVVAFSASDRLQMPNTELDLYIFTADLWLASSQLPHPDSACTSLECFHTCDACFRNRVYFVGTPAICGNLIVVLYYLVNLDLPSLDAVPNMFIQVIDWRKGHVKKYPLCERGGEHATFHLVDEQSIVVVSEGRVTLYTLQGPGGSLQRRITYLLPNLKPSLVSSPEWRALPYYVVYATPSFHGVVAHPDLMPSYVPSPESQIMVLEILPRSWPVIMVINMAIFSEKTIRSETPVEVPWSDWGPEFTWCFPHHPSHRISVFGSKMAYALPRDRTPEPGQRVEALSSEDHFYVHIWDFNKRLISRSENMYDPNSPGVVIRTPGRLAQSCFDEDLTSNRPYTASVCAERFSTHRFDRFFLEQYRLALIWLPPGLVDIQVVSPVPIEVGLDLERDGRENAVVQQKSFKTLQGQINVVISENCANTYIDMGL